MGNSHKEPLTRFQILWHLIYSIDYNKHIVYANTKNHEWDNRVEIRIYRRKMEHMSNFGEKISKIR